MVLPYINMNLPRVCTCSQSWNPLPPASPYHPSGSPQCTSPRILYPASNLDWWFVSYMMLSMFQCHSPKLSHPLPLPQAVFRKGRGIGGLAYCSPRGCKKVRHEWVTELNWTEESEMKLATLVESSKKHKNSRKTSTSALLTKPKPLTVWITTNCGKFWKTWEYQTTWSALEISVCRSGSNS